MLLPAAIFATQTPQAATPGVQLRDTVRHNGNSLHRSDSTRCGTEHTALGADTAARHETDSLGFAADSTDLATADSTAQVWFAADSLGLLYKGSPEAYYRTVADPAEVFGPLSFTPELPAIHRTVAHPLTVNPVFQSFILLLCATYLLLLYRHLGDVLLLFSRVLRTQSSGNRMTEEPRSMVFTRFLNITTTIGLLFIGVAVIRAGDMLIPPKLTQLLPQAAVLTMSLLVAVAFSLIGVFQSAVIRLTGAVTLNMPFVSQLIYLKRIYFAVAVLVISPVLLLLALCPPGMDRLLIYLIAAESLIALAMYLRETLNLFLSKKVSILHWFLYLCIVEIFPITLLWLIAVR